MPELMGVSNVAGCQNRIVFLLYIEIWLLTGGGGRGTKAKKATL